MKFAIVLLAVVAVASGQFNSFPAYTTPRPIQYNKYNPYQQNQYQRFTTPAPYRPYVSSTPAPVYPTYAPPTVQVAPVVYKNYNGDARSANTVKYGNEINPDGSYAYFYETDNGIAAQETGVPRNFGGNPPVAPDVAQGSFSWTSPEGQPIAISYIADEFGYQPTGDAIPTPPPVPPQIARALEYIARNAKQ